MWKPNWLRILLVMLAALLVMSLLQQQQAPQFTTMNYSDLMVALEAQPSKVTEIDIVNGSNEATVHEQDETQAAKVVMPNPAGQAAILTAADKAHVKVIVTEKKATLLDTILGLIFSPLTLLIVFYWWIMRRQGGLFGGMTNSGAQEYAPTADGKTFKDVAGCNEAKAELVEVVEFLRDPSSFKELGAALPRGVLLIGPPGNGKTLLAKAVAGEAGVPFFAMSASQFVEIFVGAGAGRARDLFKKARKQMPCIIFIDEIDAVGRHRGAGIGGGHDEREQTLNEILVQMDGFKENEAIVLIAATNRPDILDPAVTRAGRFDRHITVDQPDVNGREEIFEIHMRGKPVASDVSTKVLARLTPGFSGADIAASCNEAATVAHRRYRTKDREKILTLGIIRNPNGPSAVPVKRVITMEDFSEGIDRVLGGPARQRLMSEEDRRNTAVHEVGHAAVGYELKGDPIRKVTIMPRSKALGFTLTTPEKETLNMTKEQLINEIAKMMGGRVAQELVLKTVDTGAANDFEQATNLARRMVTKWGMSKLGNISISDESTSPFLGRAMSSGANGTNWGPAILNQADIEVQALLNEGYKRAHDVIAPRLKNFDKVVDKLLEKETILGDEFVAEWTAPIEPAQDEAKGKPAGEAADANSHAPPTDAAPKQIIEPHAADGEQLPSDQAAEWPASADEASEHGNQSPDATK